MSSVYDKVKAIADPPPVKSKKPAALKNTNIYPP